MRSSKSLPYVVVLITLMGGVAALIWAVDIQYDDASPVLLDLPDQVGDWHGDEILYCTNKEAKKTFLVSTLNGERDCPDCGRPLETASYDELIQLPGDTVMRKKQYTNQVGQVLTASIVLSGKQRSSIHRPQVCLTGGGREIVHDEVISLPVGEDDKLKVMLLDLTQPIPLPNGSIGQYSGYYAYWFAGKRHETPHHAERMIWMAADKVLFGSAHRWAYVSISGRRNPSRDDHKNIVREFLLDFYPMIQTTGS
jgi:hypothetical protein